MDFSESGSDCLVNLFCKGQREVVGERMCCRKEVNTKASRYQGIIFRDFVCKRIPSV